MATCKICKATLGTYESNHINGKLCCNSCYAVYERLLEKELASHPAPEKQPEEPQSEELIKEVEQGMLPARNEKGEPLVQVARDLTEFQAMHIVNHLTSEGIDACTSNSHTTSADPAGVGIATGGVRVFVYESNKARAKEEINRFEEKINSDGRPYAFLVQESNFTIPLFVTGFLFPVLFFLYPYEQTALINFLILCISLAAGFFLSNHFATYRCYDSSCFTENPRHAEICNGCHREIKGILKKADEIYEKEEELGLSE